MRNLVLYPRPDRFYESAAHYHLFGALPLWSLYCELVYYTIYPALRKIRATWTVKLIAAYAISVLLIVLFIADSRHLLILHRVFFHGARWYLALSVISLPSWLLGVLLAERACHFKKEILPRALWGWRLAVFGSSAFFVTLKMQLHINYDYSMIWFALLLYKWLEKEIIYYRAHTAPLLMQYMGKSAYSLYLCHMLWFALLGHIFANTGYTWPAYVALPVVLSWVVYLLLEHPSHQLAQKVGEHIAARYPNRAH